MIHVFRFFADIPNSGRVSTKLSYLISSPKSKVLEEKEEKTQPWHIGIPLIPVHGQPPQMAGPSLQATSWPFGPR